MQAEYDANHRNTDEHAARAQTVQKRFGIDGALPYAEQLG